MCGHWRVWLVAVVLGVCWNQNLVAQATVDGGAVGAVTLYFVQHGEMDLSDPTVSLTEQGHARSTRLVRTLERVPLTHVFSSHTLRSRQAVSPTAEAHGLRVDARPPLGSRIGSETIGDTSPSTLAIGPLASALESLPEGSSALVGVNSNNLFAILHRLGVPTAADSGSCRLGDTCVPCLDNSCFPTGEFDNLWVLVLPQDGDAPMLIWLKY